MPKEIPGAHLVAYPLTCIGGGSMSVSDLLFNVFMILSAGYAFYVVLVTVALFNADVFVEDEGDP